MSRYIDADAFERAVMFSDDKDLQDVIYRLRDYPSADVVEVVRCKDCKYYDPKECCVAFGDWFGEVNMIPMGFCSLGERREE